MLSQPLRHLGRVQDCFCVPGYQLTTINIGQANQTMGCVLIVTAFNAHKTLIVGSVTAVTGAGTIAAIVMGLLWLLRVHIAAFTLQRAKKRGPPGELPQKSQKLCAHHPSLPHSL